MTCALLDLPGLADARSVTLDGLAMHRRVTDPLHVFVRLLDDDDPNVRARPRSADLGYSRSYHGDRPFSDDGYDDDSLEASGTVKALVERIVQEVDFLIPIRALTLAELRCLIVEPAERARPWLVRNPARVRELTAKIRSFTDVDALTCTQMQLLVNSLRSIEELRSSVPEV